jgi:hypothetical protein
MTIVVIALLAVSSVQLFALAWAIDRNRQLQRDAELMGACIDRLNREVRR